jgi:hypothetical protein
MKYDVISGGIVIAEGVTMEQASRAGLLKVGTTLVVVSL